jgi:hypothetical protein
MLGCSIKELQLHLESKWAVNMSWENHGKVWEVDHIIPLCSDKSLEGFIRLNHYTNLQPLTVRDNDIKGKKNL